MSLQDYFADDPDVQAMSEEERTSFFSSLGDRKNLENFFSDDADVAAMQPEERKQFFDALAPEPSPTLGQMAGAAVTGSFKQAGGSALEGFGGLTRFVGEALPDAGVLENLGASMVQSGQGLQQAAAPEREIIRRGAGEAGAFLGFDVPSEVIRQAPTMLAGGAFAAAGKGTAALVVGLGLAIAKQAVDAHGGAIRVQNVPEKGCIFVLEFPIQ